MDFSFEHPIEEIARVLYAVLIKHLGLGYILIPILDACKCTRTFDLLNLPKYISISHFLFLYIIMWYIKLNADYFKNYSKLPTADCIFILFNIV